LGKIFKEQFQAKCTEVNKLIVETGKKVTTTCSSYIDARKEIKETEIIT